MKYHLETNKVLGLIRKSIFTTILEKSRFWEIKTKTGNISKKKIKQTTKDETLLNCDLIDASS